MNLKNIIVLKRARHRSIHFVQFHLQKALELASLSSPDGNQKLGGGGVISGKKQRGEHWSQAGSLSVRVVVTRV